MYSLEAVAAHHFPGCSLRERVPETLIKNYLGHKPASSALIYLAEAGQCKAKSAVDAIR
jgi:hypothetical protein